MLLILYWNVFFNYIKYSKYNKDCLFRLICEIYIVQNISYVVISPIFVLWYCTYVMIFKFVIVKCILLEWNDIGYWDVLWILVLFTCFICNDHTQFQSSITILFLWSILFWLAYFPVHSTLTVMTLTESVLVFNWSEKTVVVWQIVVSSILKYILFATF